MSLSHLIREAAIRAVLTGEERIEKPLLEAIELDHAAVEEAAATQRDTRQKNRQRKNTMSHPMPPARRVPVVPRPREGELSGSYLGRLARANRTELRTFVRLLSQLPVQLPADEQDLAVMLLTLNDAAFARLLTYTGHCQPTVSPRRSRHWHPRHSGCPANHPPSAYHSCRNRRSTVQDAASAAAALTSIPACSRTRRRACATATGCYGQGRGQRLDFALLPEVAAAQRRLDRLVSRRGSSAAMRAYRIAGQLI